jgi:hypothetical protein
MGSSHRLSVNGLYRLTLHPLCRILVSPFRLDDVYLSFAQRTPCSSALCDWARNYSLA